MEEGFGACGCMNNALFYHSHGVWGLFWSDIIDMGGL